MRVNVAFGIMLSFAMLEMILLQAVVLVNGHAHAITKPAFLPTEVSGGFGSQLGKRGASNHVCNIGGQLACQTDNYCIADDYGFVACCPDGEDCRPPTTCVAATDAVNTPCDAELGCLVCNTPPDSECVRMYNVRFTIINFYCDSYSTIFSMSLTEGLVSTIQKWPPHTTTTTSLSEKPSGEQTPSIPASTSTDTSQDGMVTRISSTWTTTRIITGNPSPLGAGVSLVTITIINQPTQATPSSTNGTPDSGTGADDGPSHPGTGTKVGAAIGAISICVLIGVGAWFAYRCLLSTRKPDPTAPPPQAPSAGTDHRPDAVELEAVGSQRAELDHAAPAPAPAPVPRSEMDASPRPSELDSSARVELESPPVSPLPLVGNGGSSPAIGHGRSPVSPLESCGPVSEEAAPAGARGPPADAGRYGPGGFLNPEYALRDGLFSLEDDRQVEENGFPNE
ncbi:uncharacterized protein BKCO1_5800019 [Diplodia corticola]|uniref:Uncharacterized protein n=1 Tax=Diplodia corticola TaxID=236234 RepID=A0A1J9RQB0_9PEZI|nr:uncharacterized protein BKCO1_5800019 [Diplodia corticola]OJD30639.1 hypothetical protein BKCO1_5800019 [Diplodia corticola]